MTLRARWPWILALVACRGDGCGCRGHQDDSSAAETAGDSDLIEDTACEATWYADEDNDGYGDPNNQPDPCGERPPGAVSNSRDCDDADPDVHPGIPEVCGDLKDNDCDGEPDCAPPKGDAAPEDASGILTGGEASYLGMGMALVDFDGDGVRDLAVSDPAYDDPTEDGVYIVRGPILGAAPVWDAAVARLSSDDRYSTGALLQAADLDGDGYADLALAQGSGGLDAVWLAYGPFEGEVWLSSAPTATLSIEDSYTGTRNIEPAVGDVIGDDGQQDVFLRLSRNPGAKGSLFALAGPVTADGDLAEEAESVFITSDDENDNMGQFAVVGDLNADGRADMAMSYHLTCASFELPSGSFTEGDFCDAYLSDEINGLGQQYADAGDVNGDGYADVIASDADIYEYSIEQGGARIYSGADLSALETGGALPEEDGYLAEIDDIQNGDNQLGHGMATPGDLDGDGYSEILVSAPTWATRAEPDDHYGAAFLWFGPLEGKYDPESSADWTITSPTQDTWFGFRVIAAPADAQNNATILLSAMPFLGTSTVYQFTPGGF